MLICPPEVSLVKLLKCLLNTTKYNRKGNDGDGGGGGGGGSSISRGSFGKHQGPKRKRLSRAPGGHKSAAGYTALAGPGAKGRAEAVTPDPNHPPTYTPTPSHIRVGLNRSGLRIQIFCETNFATTNHFRLIA